MIRKEKNNKDIDIALRAAEISKEMKSEVLGIGHFILAAYESEYNEPILEKISEDTIINNYLYAYSQKCYSKDNVSPGNNKLTTFAREYIDLIQEEMNKHPKSFNKYVIKSMVESSYFEKFNNNFHAWLEDGNLDVTKRFNPKAIEIEDAFAKVDFVTNLNAKVERQKPVIIGREKELEHVTATLLKKTKTNAVLVGDAGVGKTAIVEKLAYDIVTGNVHNSLKDKTILELNLGSLVAGTHFRGDFEKRLNKFMDIVKKHPDVILFIDEFHNIMGAGSSVGDAMGASDLLKPMLARGEIKVIGATTYDEYRKFVEKDRAFERRFEKIDVNEPGQSETLTILKGLKTSFEEFHTVDIEDEALTSIVNLCEKYIASRHFPDKAIDVLDAACVSVKMNDATTVTKDDIINAVEKISNVRIVRSGKPSKTYLTKEFESVLKGQTEPIEQVSEIIELIDLGLVDPNRPMASMLFAGPTGVGKTELAKQIAKTYFGSEKKLIRLDMSEYSNEADSTKIFGSAPGYVGYDEASPLLDGVKKQPYSVVLLDEVEKTNRKILNSFLQILDNGFATTSTGEKIDFRHTIIIMTSNLGFHQTDVSPISFGQVSEQKRENKKVENALQDFFAPEFLNRIDNVVYFNRLDKNVIKEIASAYASTFGDYELDDDDIEEICELANVEKNGAREIQRVVRTKILPNKVKAAAII